MANDIIATAGLDISQFKTSTSAMVSAADGAGKAIEKVGRNGRRDLGGVAMQAQDIAVQLQSGTDAARVLGQQGSQIASLFGPTGAIIGGVIAIGAAIYTWVTSAEQTNAELEKLSKWTIEEAKRLREINAAKKEETLRIKEQSQILRTQREIGQNQADDLKRKIDLENQIQDIQEKGRKEGVTEENINAQIKAAKELAYLEKRAAEVDRERARIQKVSDEANAKAREEQQAAEIREQNRALKRQLEGETEIQRARQLLLQAAKLEQNLIFKGGVERANQEKEILRLRIEAKDIQDRANKKQAEDAKKLNAEIVGNIAGAVQDVAKKLAETTKDAAKDAIIMAKEAKKIADDAQQKAKDAVEDKIADRLKTPQQRKEDRAAQKARERAIRSIDARERTGEAAKARGAYGQKNVFAHSPSKATAMAEKALQARALQNITAATLVVGSVTHK